MKALAGAFMAAGTVSLMTAASHAAAQETAGPLISLPDAIRTAEQALNGRVFEAETEAEDGRTQHELKLIDLEDRVYEIEIDGETGQIISRDEQRLEGLRRRWLNSEELHAVTRAERPLADVITALEAETGATVHEAEVYTEDERVVYELELSGPGSKEHEAVVNVLTGDTMALQED